jgi:hypothetical protein
LTIVVGKRTLLFGGEGSGVRGKEDCVVYVISLTSEARSGRACTVGFGAGGGETANGFDLLSTIPSAEKDCGMG